MILKFADSVSYTTGSGTTNMEAGVIFEEYDTGDHYIWSGSAWNEMT